MFATLIFGAPYFPLHMTYEIMKERNKRIANIRPKANLKVGQVITKKVGDGPTNGQTDGWTKPLIYLPWGG